MLKINNLSKKYPNKLIGPFNFEIASGQSLVIIGHSGSGKTTLIKMIANIISPSSGTVRYHNNEITANEIMYISQGGTLFNHLNIKENLALTSLHSEQTIIKVLERLKLDESYLQKYPFELSGGERQRIDITRALLSDAKLLILDEVFSALDSQNKEAIAKLLEELKVEYNLTIILITHDIYDAIYIADQLMVIYEGEMTYLGSGKDMLKSDVLINSNLISQRQLRILKEGVQ